MQRLGSEPNNILPTSARLTEQKMKIYRQPNFYYENNNLTNKQLAELANCSESTINKAKRELGLTFAMLKDPKWDYSKLLTITEDSMYWAGFILADGCFSKEERKVKLSVSSSIEDVEHISKLKNWLNTDNKLYYSKDNCCSFSVYSKKYIPEIMNFWNFSYRKTYVTYNVPDYIINHEYFKYFIVGLIDGDGSVISTVPFYRINITQHVSQVDFFENLQEYLGNQRRKLQISKRDNTVSLNIQRPELRYKIKQWYFELGDLPLARKLSKMI